MQYTSTNNIYWRCSEDGNEKGHYGILKENIAG